MRAWSAGLGLVLLLAGCAGAPPIEPPPLDVEIPVGWAAAHPEGTESPRPEWWQEFGDPELGAVVEEALSHNHDLKAAEARLAAARATATIAGAGQWPTLDAGATGARNKNIFVGLPIPGGDVLSNYSTSYSTSLSSSWELDLWGRIRKGKSAALADVAASQADLAGARLSLAGQTTKAWLSVTEARLQLALAEETLAAYRETADVAFERYERGLISSVDVHLTRNSAASAAALVALRKEQLEQSRRRLELLLGRYPAARVEGTDELPPAPPAVPAGLPAELVGRRPDLVAAERRLAASHARIGQAQRNRLPKISLTASAGTTSRELGDLLDGDFSVWSLVGNLVAPLFQGGRLKAQVDLTRATAQQQLALYAQSVLGAFAEVEAALSAEQHLAVREAALTRASESADAARNLSEERYRQGVSDLLSLLESQRRALNARSELLTLRRERLSARVDLHLALGGGFDRAQPAVVSQNSPSSPSR